MILYAYLIAILNIIYIECYLHDKNLFLLWTDHPKTCIIWSFIELSSLCSSLNFLDENLLWPYTKQVPEDRQQGI